MAIFLDTNILIYSVATMDDERSKREIALQLLDRTDCVLSVQILQEFYAQATRATRSNRIPHDIAMLLIEGWLRFRVQQNTLDILMQALDLRREFGISIWDCLVVSAANATGCEELYTEDLSHGQMISGVKIVNPFRA